MAKNILFIFLILISLAGSAQTAVDFTSTDCSGVTHTLFSELDSGNVAVICWVMPCGSCVGPSLTTNKVVRSFDTTYPGKVRMFLVDDYANTNCTSLQSWATSNHISGVSCFSNADIKMSDYGQAGMPKIVVTGGKNRSVYFSAVNTVNADVLKDSIQSALDGAGTGMEDLSISPFTLTVYPNPSAGRLSLGVLLKKPSDLSVAVYDLNGRFIQSTDFPGLSAGNHVLPMDGRNLKKGNYLVRISDGKRSVSRPFTMIR